MSMRRQGPAVIAVLLLAGCAGLAGPFPDLTARAENADVPAQIELARAYADPGRGQVNPLLAAKWCYIAHGMRPALAQPACRDLLAGLPAYDRSEGFYLAQEWLAGPQSYLNL